MRGEMPYSHGMFTIRKIAVLVILSVSIDVYAQTTKTGFSFSLSPQAGVLYGQSEEIVYKFPSEKSYYSELLWDLKPMVYAGLRADYGPEFLLGRNGISSSLSVKIGLPLATGILEDRDWANLSYDYVTHYSRHDTSLNNAFLADFQTGYSWRLGSFDLKAYGEFSYMHFSWNAAKGFAQYPGADPSDNYPPWHDSLEKIYFNGKVIRYTQDWFIFSPGLSVNWRVERFLTLSGHAAYSPLIYCVDKDDHLLRNLTFRDYLYFGHYFSGGAEAVFSFIKGTDFSIFAVYKHISGSRGHTNIEDAWYYDTAGSGYSAIDAGLAVKIKIPSFLTRLKQ